MHACMHYYSIELLITRFGSDRKGLLGGFVARLLWVLVGSGLVACGSERAAEVHP